MGYRLKIKKRGAKTYTLAKNNKGNILDFDSRTDAARMARVFKTTNIKIIKKTR